MRAVRLVSFIVVASSLLSCKGSEPKQVTITIAPESVSLATGETQQLTATVGGTDNTSVTWTTNASSVATVSASGLVTAVGTGSATITATSDEDADVFADVAVTVTSSATTLTSGVQVSGISGAAGSQRHYRIAVPSGATQLQVASNGTGDMDLYVRRASEATRTTYDCRSNSASSAEVCTIANPQAGDWYVMLYGFTAYSNVNLMATVTGGSTTPPASGFTIANSTSTPSVNRGSTSTMTVTATRAGSFTGSIDLTVTGLPAGVTASFAPATLSSSQTSSTLTFTATTTATLGSVPITVRANSTGQTERTATATLSVNAASSSSIDLLPSTDVIYVARGQYTWGTLGITSTSYTGGVDLSSEAVGAGLTVLWASGEDVAGSATGYASANDFHQRFKLSAAASAPLGNSSITLRGAPLGTGVPAKTTTITVVVVDAQAVGNPAWTQLAMGGVNCGRRADDKTYCWGGLNSYGDGTGGGAVRVPFIAAMGREFTSLTYGGTHGCGVETGVAYCWGSASFGVLGNGDATTSRRTPVQVSGSQTWNVISANISNTCALTTAGAAYCWGAQFQGALGDGVVATTNADYKTTPTAVLGGLTFASISVGTGHTCALTPAGVAWCWGANASGQLGDGSTTDRSQPAQVSGGLTFTKISAGGSHTCAITNAGKAYCWGAANRVGDGTPANQPKSAPYALPSAELFADISAGSTHSCAISTAGTAYCWGDNTYGQIGNGTSGSQIAQRAVTAVAGGLSFTKIMARINNSCGVTSANALYCWGFNTYGEVGDGATTHRNVPTLAKTF